MHSVSVILILIVSLTAANCAESGDLNWWKHAVFYQIYPRSFMDKNNDGIGDLAGILEKLPYLANTGVTAVWLSPIFKSPQVDQGYDISDYYEVDESYGTNEELINLINEAHKLGIKVILDFVPNHTSNKHEWFVKSENNDTKYKDYYIWLDGKEGTPPNNWVSLFKNSTWTWSNSRKQYYLHQFAQAQPDLNYRNPEVVQAMTDVMQYWLDKGVDGFRVDAVPFLIEDADFNDEPLSNLPGYNENDYQYLNHTLTMNLQETFDVIYYWREFLDNYTRDHGGDQRVMMTEAYAGDKTMLYYGTADGSRLGAHFTFNFNFITDVNMNSTAKDFATSINKWLDEMPSRYTPNWVAGNHDNHRVATRFGPGNVDGINMLVQLLPGVGVTYNGEEIGMEDGEVSFDQGQDPSARDPETFDELSRDFERTPFHWDLSKNAGFNTGAVPWLPVSEKYTETNVISQIYKENSHYNIYKRLVNIRKSKVCTSGSTLAVGLQENVLVIGRSLEKEYLTLVVNMGSEKTQVDVTKYVNSVNVVILTSVGSQYSYLDNVDPSKLSLAAHESVVITSFVQVKTSLSATSSLSFSVILMAMLTYFL